MNKYFKTAEEVKDLDLNRINFITGYADGPIDEVDELIKNLFGIMQINFDYFVIKRGRNYKQIGFSGFSTGKLKDLVINPNSDFEYKNIFGYFDLKKFRKENFVTRMNMLGFYPEIGITECVKLDVLNGVEYTQNFFKEFLIEDSLSDEECFKEEILSRPQAEIKAIEEKYWVVINTHKNFDRDFIDAGGIIYITDADYISIDCNYDYYINKRGMLEPRML